MTFFSTPECPVQLCGQVARAPRKFTEAAARGDDDEDGGVGQGLNEEQAAGGGAEELNGSKARPFEVVVVSQLEL